MDDRRPNRMTCAIGVWISLPGRSPANASGTSARPDANAVMKIGASRSRAPRRTASAKSVTPSSSCRCRMCDTSMMPLRVAMPNTVMKPMIAAIDSTPPETYTPITPPIKASGRLSITNAASRAEPKAMCRSRPMPITTPMLSSARIRDARWALSNWPPYSTR